MNVYLIAWVLCSVCAGVPMVWIPNTEGLFSQFLQLRIMVFIKYDLNVTTLTIPAINTTHSKSININICKVFRLPFFVQCRPVQSVNRTQCRENSTALRRYYYGGKGEGTSALLTSGSLPICYNMVSPFLGGQTRRDAFLRVVSLSPVVDFQPHLREKFHAYKRYLLESNNNKEGTAYSYTVVHWRRGDQLTSRCAQGKDTSVNCLSVQDLVREVQQYTSGKVIYLATNEANLNYTELDLLQQARIQVFNPRPAGYSAGSVPAVVVDVQLMIDATTFLGWGVSTIHDLVEHTRMVQNKTWCTTVETNVTYPTWCWLQAQRLQGAHVATQQQQKKPLSLAQRRSILLEADAHMHTHPLVLSDYNISNMPAYLSEIEDCAKRMRYLH